MFERFTDGSRRAVVVAQEEVVCLHHESLGSEHILLGLLREGTGIAGHAFRAIGIDLEAAQQQAALYRSPVETASTRMAPFSPRAKKALELALRESIQFGTGHSIRTEHLLLGIIGADGGACKVINALGFTPSRVRATVIELMGGLPPEYRQPVSHSQIGPAPPPQ